MSMGRNEKTGLHAVVSIIKSHLLKTRPLSTAANAEDDAPRRLYIIWIWIE